VSSARFEDEIRPMDKASEAIFALKPVTFRYKHELDPEGIAQFGLVAEQVEEVNRDLVAHDKQGHPYTVRYDAVNNEFLKAHRKMEEQGETITALKGNDAKQEATIARLEQTVAALTATVQKASAQLEMSKSVPETILNNQ